MFEAPVDRLGRAVARAGVVEVGEHVSGALLQRPSKRDELAERSGHTVAYRVDQLLHQFLALGPIGFAVGRAHAPVAPGGLDFYVLVIDETAALRK